MPAIKISPLETVLLCLTALCLVGMGGFYAGGRSAEPARVDVQFPAAETLPPPAGAYPAESPALVDLNTATAAQLEALPGIGAKRAADIVADRTANGPFRHPEDITRVKGIGEGTLEQIIDLITVSQ